MSFLETVTRARTYLESQGKVSLRALQRECDIEGDALDDLIRELCETLEVARCVDGRLESLAAPAARPAPHETPPPQPTESDAEHRQLTVMFCDLQGSTELAQSVDAEEYRLLLSRYYDEAKKIIDAYQGHVAQYLGDGMLVFFGYPLAHEDDPERAVRAGLDIIERLTGQNSKLLRQRGVSLAVRVGIHTGPVIVGDLAGHGNDFAIGDTLNTAARIQGAAAPNTVMLSDTTWRRVAGVFECEDRGEVTLKGLEMPIHLRRPIRPVAARGRFDAARGRLTEFVGRGREIGLLAERWAEAAEGRGQTVLITGPAGIGKSRLALMLHDILQGLPHARFECHASPHTSSVPFSGIIELVRNALRITPGMAPKAQLRRLQRAARTLEVEVRGFAPLMAVLLGLPASDTDSVVPRSPDALRRKTIEALSAWTLALSRTEPVLVLIEDLQWQDSASIELLHALMDLVSDRRILLLLTARPEFEAASIPADKSTAIRLEHLDSAQAREMIRAVLGGRRLPDETVNEILRRADGLPFYLEELTRAAMERETDGEFVIPESLHDSLMARLDHTSAPKEIAQVASLLGRQFHYELLHQVCGMDEEVLREGLRQLIGSDVLVQLGSPPKASYLFKQPLLRDTAYQSMVSGTRERRHRRIAEVMAGSMPEIVQNQPELIAHHFAEGGDFRSAIKYWKLAGEQAAERQSLTDALTYVARALDQLPFIFDTEERQNLELQLQLAEAAVLTWLLGHAHDDTGLAYARVESVLNEGGEGPYTPVAEVAVGLHKVARGVVYVALDHFTRALETAEVRDSDLLRVAALHGTGQARFLLGEFEEADEALRQAVQLYDPARHDFIQEGFAEDSGLGALGWGQWAAFELGDVERAHELATRAVEIGQRSSRPAVLASALWSASLTAINRGDLNRALELIGEAEILAARMNFVYHLEQARTLQALASGLFTKDPDKGDEAMEAAARMTAAGHHLIAPWLLDRCAEVQLRNGRLEDAERALGDAAAIGQSTCQFFRDAEIERLRAELHLRAGDRTDKEIESALRGAVDTARRHRARFAELRAAASLARFLRGRGRAAEAHTRLEDALGWFKDSMDTPELIVAHALARDLASRAE